MLLCAALIWGCAFSAQSSAMDHAGPWTFVCIRSLLAAVSLYVIRKFFPPQSHDASVWKNGMILGALLFAASALQQFGILHTSAGKAGFLTALYIVIVPLLSVCMGKKLSLRAGISALIACAGLWFLSFQSSYRFETGDLLLLGCAFVYALHIMMIDQAGKEDVILLSCIQFLTAGVLALPMMISEMPDVNSVAGAWVEILYAGILSSGGGYTLQMIGQKYTPPTEAGMLLSMESVFAAIGGFIILHQVLSVHELIGCALIFAAVILSQLSDSN